MQKTGCLAAIAIMTALMFTLLLGACSKPTSIGIIGGADGPTAIVVSENNNQNNENEGEKTDMQNPIVTIEMENGGIIKVELYPVKAENTVNNFISLVNKGYYDGLIFHRVIPGFMIQGGDPNGTGSGGPGYSIKAEFANAGYTKNDITHTRGVISMARQGSRLDPASAYDTAGSQFFIMTEEAPHLDKDYAAFGKVTEGLDVIDAIVAVQTGVNDKPLEDQVMKKVTVETFGAEYPEPEVINK